MDPLPFLQNYQVCCIDSGKQYYYRSVYFPCTAETEGSVRLFGVNGVNDTEGRVEILYDGKWGTVCDASWGIRDGETVCRELGFEIEHVNQVNINPSGR